MPITHAVIFYLNLSWAYSLKLAAGWFMYDLLHCQGGAKYWPISTIKRGRHQVETVHLPPLPEEPPGYTQVKADNLSFKVDIFTGIL